MYDKKDLTKFQHSFGNNLVKTPKELDVLTTLDTGLRGSHNIFNKNNISNLGVLPVGLKTLRLNFGMFSRYKGDLDLPNLEELILDGWNDYRLILNCNLPKLTKLVVNVPNVKIGKFHAPKLRDVEISGFRYENDDEMNLMTVIQPDVIESLVIPVGVIAKRALNMPKLTDLKLELNGLAAEPVIVTPNLTELELSGPGDDTNFAYCDFGNKITHLDMSGTPTPNGLSINVKRITNIEMTKYCNFEAIGTYESLVRGRVSVGYVGNVTHSFPKAEDIEVYTFGDVGVGPNIKHLSVYGGNICKDCNLSMLDTLTISNANEVDLSTATALTKCSVVANKVIMPKKLPKIITLNIANPSYGRGLEVVGDTIFGKKLTRLSIYSPKKMDYRLPKTLSIESIAINTGNSKAVLNGAKAEILVCK